MTFSVPLPSAGDAAIVEFKFDDLTKLQAEFGDGYALAIMKKLDANDADALRKCLEIGLHGGEIDRALSAAPFSTLAEAVALALQLRLIGAGDA